MADVKYNADSIVSYENLKHIRAVPKAYIKSSDSEGIVHTVWEYIANSVDEVGMRPDGGKIYVALFKDGVSNRFQIVIKDDGRGIPVAKLVKALTSMGTSGKIAQTNAYRSSGGQLGMGAKAAPALSTIYRTLSVNYLENKIGSVTVKDGEVTGTETKPMEASSGVTAAFELDIEQFFPDGKDFASVGYLDLVDLCRRLNVFNENINFQFYIYSRLIPEEYWTASAPEALGIIDNLIFNSPHEIIYDSASVLDKSSYLFDVSWKNASRDIIFSESIRKKAKDDNDKLSFDLKFYFTKKGNNSSSLYFIAVNNVYLIEKNNNDPVMAFLAILRYAVAKYQPTPEYRNFVLETYNFPTLLLAIDIKYDGAKFSGVTKTNFRDAEFSKQFTHEVVATITEQRGEDYWYRLSEALKSDITTQYSRFYDVKPKKSDDRRLFLELHYIQNFHECKSANRSECELYLVEGTSAGNIAKTRDSNFQAIYEARGKPFNAANVPGSLADKRKALMKYEIYQDISRILNISAGTTDMSTARFSKIIIATDADPDGYHIAALHLSNLYILNPLIVESGMVYIARPPLYSMEIGKGKYVFIRDKKALRDASIEFVYRNILDIRIVTPSGVLELDDELFRETIDIVKQVGGKYMTQAIAFNVPINIIERLVIGVKEIYPKVNYKALPKLFDSPDGNLVRVRADEHTQSMTISIGHKDYHIPLERIGHMIVKYVLADVKRYAADKLVFEVRTKAKGSAYCDNPLIVSVAGLFDILAKVDDSMPFTLRRYKGLGEMPTDSCSATLMNPETRVITQITSVGSVDTCMNLLGKDSTWRKQLLAGSDTLSATFVRENELTFTWLDS